MRRSPSRRTARRPACGNDSWCIVSGEGTACRMRSTGGLRSEVECMHASQRCSGPSRGAAAGSGGAAGGRHPLRPHFKHRPRQTQVVAPLCALKQALWEDSGVLTHAASLSPSSPRCAKLQPHAFFCPVNLVRQSFLFSQLQRWHVRTLPCSRMPDRSGGLHV